MATVRTSKPHATEKDDLSRRTAHSRPPQSFSGAARVLQSGHAGKNNRGRDEWISVGVLGPGCRVPNIRLRTGAARNNGGVQSGRRSKPIFASAT